MVYVIPQGVNMLKSVNDVLYRSKGFEVNFGVVIKNNKPGKPNTVSSYRNEDTKLITVNIDSFYKRFISFNKISYNTESRNRDKTSYVFSIRHFHQLLKAIETCHDWLRLKKFEYIFIRDSNGHVKSIGERPNYLPTIQLKNGTKVRFSPAVVVDSMDGLKYEGISIYTKQGAIINLTCEEFLVFHFSMKNFLNNSYSNTIQLISTASSFLGMKR